jgi:IS30 family transposase
MGKITDEEIKIIENRLNDRTRERLGFKTSTQVIQQSLPSFALRA